MRINTNIGSLGTVRVRVMNMLERKSAEEMYQDLSTLTFNQVQTYISYLKEYKTEKSNKVVRLLMDCEKFRMRFLVEKEVSNEH